MYMSVYIYIYMYVYDMYVTVLYMYVQCMNTCAIKYLKKGYNNGTS